MSAVRSVLVAGSRFGQFYAAGVAADPRFVLRGILGQGSQRSQALAQRLGVDFWSCIEAVAQDVQLACVAVGGAARGEQGPALAKALMQRGMDVVIEHPLLPQELQSLLRCAAQHQRRCLLNTFYPRLPAVERFIALGRELRRQRGIRHIEATCGVQVGFATLDILAAVLDGMGPWSVSCDWGGLSAMRTGELVLAGVPVSMQVLNEMAVGHDGRMTVLHRIHLTTDRGTLSLLHPHGPLLWASAVVVPEEDKDGLFPLFGQTSAKGHTQAWPASQLLMADTPHWDDIHARLWPSAAAQSLCLLDDAIELQRCNQRALELAMLWQELGERLGFPDAPPETLAPSGLEQALEPLC